MAKPKPKKQNALEAARETDVPQVQSVHVQNEGVDLKNTRGKRGKGDYVQLCVHIPKELRKPFRHAVVENDLDNSTFIEMLITDYLAKNKIK